MNQSVPPTVTWGLLAAWAVHDLEELITMPGWSEQAVVRLSSLYPTVPRSLWRVLSTTRTQAVVAIGTVGVFVAAAAAQGAQTDGRSRWFQATLAGFGWHAVTHLGQSLLYRGYTPGVVTAPTVVAPYSWWAWHRLNDAGVLEPTARSGRAAAVAAPAVVVGAQLAGRLVERALGRWRSR